MIASAASTTDREVRRAQQHAAHLLEHDAELDEREALAAVLLGDVRGSAARARWPSASTPRGRSPRSVSMSRRTSVDGRLGLEELAHGVAQLFLLLGEGEVHGVVPLVCGSWRDRRYGDRPRTLPDSARRPAARASGRRAGGTLGPWPRPAHYETPDRPHRQARSSARSRTTCSSCAARAPARPSSSTPPTSTSSCSR